MLENIKINTYSQTDGITLAEAKAHLNILDDSFDTLITDYIATGNRMLYQETSILLNGTATAFLSEFKDFLIPMGVVSSIAIYYYNAQNTRTLLSTDNYTVTEGKFWEVEMDTEPTTYDRKYPYEVEITTGVNADAMVTQTLRMIVADLFETRQSNEIGAIKQVSRSTKHQLDLISMRLSV